jgi:DNA-binding HxlR family transcriptional regulator
VLGNTYDGQICAAAWALEVVGERWSLLILRDAIFGGVTRFSDFQKNLRIAPNILSKRLEGFVNAGIMTNTRGPAQSEHLEYLLTEKGMGLMPVIIALREWGDRWQAPDGPPVVLEHRGCGGKVVQRLVCKTCDSVPRPRDVLPRPTRAMAVYQQKGQRA